MRTGPDFVECRYEIADPKSGYAHVYTKTVRLTAGKPQMTIGHNLRNTGARVIATNVHNPASLCWIRNRRGPTSR